jgi:hypothetical protein
MNLGDVQQTCSQSLRSTPDAASPVTRSWIVTVSLAQSRRSRIRAAGKVGEGLSGRRIGQILSRVKYLDERGSHLPAVSADTHQYMVERTSGKSASRSRVLRASVRIFLETDEQGQFRRRVGTPPVTPAWFAPILAPYLQFVKIHRGLAPKTTRKYIQKLSAFALYLFALYLEDAGVKELGGIAPRHVREFYENAEGPARRSYGSTLRVFFRWAAVQGWLSGSLRDAPRRPCGR